MLVQGRGYSVPVVIPYLAPVVPLDLSSDTVVSPFSLQDIVGDAGALRPLLGWGLPSKASLVMLEHRARSEGGDHWLSVVILRGPYPPVTAAGVGNTGNQ